MYNMLELGNSLACRGGSVDCVKKVTFSTQVTRLEVEGDEISAYIGLKCIADIRITLQ